MTIAKSEIWNLSEIVDEARRVLATSFRIVVTTESRESAPAESYPYSRVSVNRVAEEHETQRRKGLVRREAVGVMSAVDSQRRILRLL